MHILVTELFILCYYAFQRLVLVGVRTRKLRAKKLGQFIQKLVLCDEQVSIEVFGWVDYAPFMAKDGDELRQRFDARVKQHLTATHCDTAVASASLERLTKCVTTAAQETLAVKHHQTLRKRCASNRTRQLYEQRRRDFAKLSEDERRVAKPAISTSCRGDYREHVDGILNDMEAAERCGNSREVSRLTRLVSRIFHTHHNSES